MQRASHRSRRKAAARVATILLPPLLHLLPCAAAAPPGGAAGAAVGLDPLVADGAATWATTLPEFAARFPGAGFQWLSEAREAVRSTSPALRLFGQPVGETVVRTGEGKIRRVDISLYNRGDRGEIAPPAFAKLRADWQSRLQETVGVAPEKEAGSKKSAVGLQRTLWDTPASAVLLESSAQGGRPEFLRIRLAPRPSGASYLGNSEGNNNRTKTKSELRRHVKRGQNGDNFIDGVPMVDQGPKGYCVVASAERVFRYYGLEIDQHEMAQASKSSSRRGTNPQEMVRALDGIASKLNLRSRTLLEFDAEGFIRLVENYNREAKKKKAFDKQVVERFGRTIYIDDYYRQFDPAILTEVRARGTGYSAFQNEVKRQIDQGTPLLWGVRLGMFPEPEIPQAEGGHMRLILGYNSREGEVLYSDSWGAGHELKSMPMDEAYTMTTCVHLITPSR